ncbi:hypothetical protein JHK85_005170 [Glycine max]|uniref:Uncharacterized protein n=1 Tax=Glycine max TaxID=3847 RepID=A0A0R0L6F1_SOYBN|nr:hypothetical protein JHK85_005170 [Glycine max]KAH1061464.1 hypothetical protein GYH30_004783 [Glycine max]
MLELSPLDSWICNFSDLLFSVYNFLKGTLRIKTLLCVIKLSRGITLHFFQTLLSELLIKKKSICDLEVLLL